ncbi:PQQ-dependent sugar dehydrogenase [Tunicatimonas pelagia]|uniref:PQQ-dependent sugar dehydrogenase n=1 Tax=Tunicatimonas pelagia TaxID=931531 RepID=UPI00266717A3|nr:PQQ-dependent sugar dehydrogenase [Tunicatimonas pelagia]WKN40626.1 PQQ-dependent sugar dehydrogenase [Tunicatimonas pelagia]
MSNNYPISLFSFIFTLFTTITFAQEGQSLYVQYCASCHGEDLKGGNGPSFLDGEWKHGSGRGQITRNIKFGIAQVGMPAYEKVLDNDQLSSIVDYVLEAEKSAMISNGNIPSQLQTLDYNVDVEVFADGLEIPWAVAFAGDDKVLVTERPGRLRVIDNGELQAPVQSTPEVLHEGQGGLLDVAVDPDYDQNGWVYLSFSHALEDDGAKLGAMTKIVRGKIENNQWTSEETVFESPHDLYSTTRHHYGNRIVFDPEGYLYFSIGDRGAQDQAQDITRPNGKVHRINRDGSIPEDNPFVNETDAISSIFTYGNRNPQGLAVHPETGTIWETEHGPMGGDEVNIIQKGNNYGWPVITYGRNYNGTSITDITRKEGMEQPIIYWKPSIAVCGIEFYQGDEFPKWKNKLLVGALAYEEVRLLNIVDDRIMHDEVIMKNVGRVRDVAPGPNGAVYVIMNEPDVVLKLTASEKQAAVDVGEED